MSQLRIGDINQLYQSGVTISASSADASFPVSNLSKYGLGKVWRSAGNFIINSTNNKIDFKESGGGAELHATLTSATYTPTTLAAEIKSALEAAGGETYTVSFSTTTGKWTITTGGSYLSLLWNTGTNTATCLGPSIGFPSSGDSTGNTTYTGTNVALHTEERITFDLGSATAIDSLAIFHDKASSWKISGSGSVKLQGNASASWSSPSVDQTLSYDTTYKTVTHFFSGDQTYRYWSLKIVDPTNTNLYVEIPKVFLCKATQLTQMPSIGFEVERVDRSKKIETEYGHRYSDIYPELRRIRFAYPALSAADVATLEAVWQRVRSVVPVFVALDPLATLYDKDRFVLHGYLNDELKFTNSFYTYFDSRIVFEEAQ